MTIRQITGLFMLLLVAALASAATDNFPGRQEYPEVKIYGKAQLKSSLNKVLVIDTRSNYEYETIHINDSVNVPVANRDFVEQIRQIRNNTDKSIVFYCNGRTCYKSYKAVKKSMDSHIANVYAYDAGMFEWAESYPQHTTLLGKSPINPADLLSKQMLKQRMLEPKIFSEMAYKLGEQARILDIRDITQRSNGIGYFIGMEYWISLNHKDKILNFVRKAKRDRKRLLIYDAVGKQVRWLQYTLEQEGLKDYYFMEKGAHGFYNQIINVKRKSG